jgi:hypothetical protein
VSGESTTADVVAVAALLATLAGLAPTLLLSRSSAIRTWSQAGALVAAVAWIVLVATGAMPTVGRFEPHRLDLACAAATALVAASRPRSLATGAAATIVAATVGVHGGEDAASIAYGAGVVTAGLLALLPRPSWARAELLLPVLLVGALRWFDGLDGSIATALALASAAGAVMVAWRWRDAPWALALVAASAATTAVAGTGPAAVLLAAAAVLTLLGGGVAVVAAVPGAAALAPVLADARSWDAALLAALVVAVAVALAREPIDLPRRPGVAQALALLLGAWLLLAPARWAAVLGRRADLGAARAGLALATAVALLVAVAIRAAERPPLRSKAPERTHASPTSH